MNKKTISAVVIIVLLVIGIYQGLLKKEKPAFILAEVSLGNISQEVSETGQVKKGDEIGLSFKNAGKIEKIYVAVGEKVKAGDILAKEESAQLAIQLQDAGALLSLTQAQFDKLLAGASPEEIQSAETKVGNAKISLDAADQTLEDSYQDSLIVLDNAYLESYNSQNTAATIQRTYFFNSDQTGVKVKDNKGYLESAVLKIRTYLDSVRTNSSHENINSNIILIKEELSDISDYLKIIREACEESDYRNVVLAADKASLDTHRANINTVLANTVNSQQTIAAAKLAVSSAMGQLQVAKDSLAITTASPRQEDVDLYQAKVDQAESQVKILENQIQDTILRSPTAGEIILINKRAGELAQPLSQDSVIRLMPEAPFEIETNIYEEDVVKMAVGNPVDISLIAFPGEAFRGKVISIDPGQKLIEGVVYYEVIIDFDGIPQGIKPGMTADLIIKTSSKENVLVVSEDAVFEKDGKTLIGVLENGEVKEKEVKIGLEGTGDMVEIISGLKEGEKVILR